jgi:hypothetical protein
MTKRSSMLHIANFKMMFLLALTVVLASCVNVKPYQAELIKTYYIDSQKGDDNNDGLSENRPWKSHKKVESADLNPGDTVLFARGSAWQGGIEIKHSGVKGHPILFSNYGEGPLPKFSNPNWSDHTGNAIRLVGDFLVIDGLYFHDIAPPPNGEFKIVWSSGAVRILLDANHNVIRNCYFDLVPKAIQSHGEYTLITHNIMIGKHVLLGSPYWGPIGVQLGIGNQEVSYNTIKGFWVKDGHAWGADGGAIEMDDGRFHKDNVYIHHNRTIENCGFLEISWQFDIQHRSVKNLRVAFNISTDWQSIGFLEAPLYDSHIDHNTFDRSHQIHFNSALEVQIGTPIVRNNLFILKGPAPYIADDNKVHVINHNNWYYQISNPRQVYFPETAAGNGKPGLVNLVDAGNSDYHLTAESPLRGKAINLSNEYSVDFDDRLLPREGAWDVGALQFR